MSARTLLSGAAAGAVSTLLFTLVHDIFISDIWSSLPIMLVAGVLSGVSIAWSYGRLFPIVSRARATCAVLMLLLGLNVSVLGLVEITGGAWALVFGFFGLIVLLNAAYVAAFILLEWRRLPA